MFRPLSIFIGLRYTRAKQRNHFISFISLTSMLGIALGVAVLITVLSVMNGFDFEIKQRLFSMTPEIIVRSSSGSMQHWQKVQEQIQKNESIKAVAPFIEGQAMMSHQGDVSGVVVYGIEPAQERRLSVLEQKMVEGTLDDLKPDRYQVILGEELATHLGLGVGDPVLLIIPEASASLVGFIPRMRVFHVSGIFKIGNGFHFDRQFAFIHLSDAQKLYHLNHNVEGLRLKLDDLYQAQPVAKILREQLKDDYELQLWSDQYGAFFRTLQMEKTMMFLVLCLIIAVAAFNLVSSLVMAVTDKQSEIAILRTFGATPMSVMMIFVVQGGLIGFVGTLLGLLGGVALALNVTHIVQALEHIFGFQLFNASAYYVDYFPSRLVPSDVYQVAFAAFAMSLLATLYPAWRASRIQPAQALRYE